MKYKARSRGFVRKAPGQHIRYEKGDVFTLPEGIKPGKWMIPIPEASPSKPAKPDKSTNTAAAGGGAP